MQAPQALAPSQRVLALQGGHRLHGVGVADGARVGHPHVQGETIRPGGSAN